MDRVVIRTAALSIALALGASEARADDRVTDPQAVDLYKQSVEAYREGRFGEAADLLRQAYARTPKAVLLYNLGRACEKMGDLPCAVDAYERYLARATPPDRAAIEERLVAYKRQIESARASPPAPPPAAVEPQSPREPEARSPLPWIVAGAGVAAVGTGAVLALVAHGKHEDATNAATQEDAAHLQDSADRLTTAANITVVAGALVAIAGGVWVVLDRRASSSIRPTAGLRTTGLSITF